MKIGLLLFFILMPIAFRATEIIIKNVGRGVERKPLSFIWDIIQLLFYYGIEATYIFIHHNITGDWMIMKGSPYPNASPSFIVCSVIFIVLAVCCLNECCDDEYAMYETVKSIALVLLFFVYMVTMGNYIQSGYSQIVFNNMPYEIISQETIELQAFSDTHTTTGDIRGGRFYINGNIQDNYELYYCFFDERGSLTIRHFTYTEEHCQIFPEDNCENPRLEITTYGKSFTEYMDLSSYYSDYVLHIPNDSIIGTGINME